MNKSNIPTYRKYCFSIKEAAEYSSIGESRLRKIIEDNEPIDWVLHVGTQIRIKRELFEKWIDEQYYI